MGPNLRFECIVPQEAAEQILQLVGETFFKNYSVITWLTVVAVLRGDKFE